MGCAEVKEQNLPVLMCFFEPGNEQQKAYCIKLKDNFQHEKSIKYEIKSSAETPFGIKLKIKEQTHDIQQSFNDSEEEMQKSLNAMYVLLDKM